MNRLRKTTLLLMVAGVLILAVAVIAQAEVLVTPLPSTGDRNSSDFHTFASGSWSGVGNAGFQIIWGIAQDTVDVGEFEYTYNITAVGGGNLSSALQNFYLWVSPDFALHETPETTPPGSQIGEVTVGGKTFNALYWNNLDSDTLTIHFDSFNQPVWGSFYADDNVDEVAGSIAHNGNFAFGFMTLGESTLDYIPVPDSVPVPPAVWLFGSGLLGLVGLRRRFKK